MSELIAIHDPKQDEPEKFDFNFPEDVLIEVIAEDHADQTLPHWGVGRHSIESCTVLGNIGDPNGAASYEQSYGGFLDYTIQDMIECPGEGWWVITGITGHYTRGDGWTTDDDMDFYHEGIRRANPDEIAAA